MGTTPVHLLATIKRPGWRWNPWRGMLEHHGLSIAISIGVLSDQGVSDESSLLALLEVHEQRAELAMPGAPLPFHHGERPLA